MTRVAEGQRKRAFRPKTRTGCLTCKTRRVKCDETNPSCYQCIFTGRKCDGFNMEATPYHSKEVLGALSRSPSVGFLGSEKERQLFFFFRQKTAPQLSWFFGSDFWESLLLQAALCEPSIRHAILALGSLHAKLEQSNARDNTGICTYDFSLRNYNQAINLLVQPFSQGQQVIDVCLICSLLFACFETMQGSFGPAITHVKGGVKIMCEVEYNVKTRRHQHDVLRVSRIPYVPMDILEQIFVRLDLQMTQMVSEHKWEMRDSLKAHGQKGEIPTIFSNLLDARDSLVSQWHIASYPTGGSWDRTNEKSLAIPQTGTWEKKSTSILARWSSAYDAYLNIRGDNLTDAKRKGTAVLSILKELGSAAMMLSKTTVDDQREWDVLCPMFQKIVSLADDIVALDQKSVTGKPTYCIDMALVGPLFEIACRCRDPLIRRRAISTLRTCGRIEGTWNAFSASEVAQRIVNIEEASLESVRSCEDIPGWARISSVSPVFDPIEQRATLVYSRQRGEHDLVTMTIEEVIEW